MYAAPADIGSRDTSTLTWPVATLHSTTCQAGLCLRDGAQLTAPLRCAAVAQCCACTIVARHHCKRRPDTAVCITCAHSGLRCRQRGPASHSPGTQVANSASGTMGLHSILLPTRLHATQMLVGAKAQAWTACLHGHEDLQEEVRHLCHVCRKKFVMETPRMDFLKGKFADVADLSEKDAASATKAAGRPRKRARCAPQRCGLHCSITHDKAIPLAPISDFTRRRTCSTPCD